MNNLWIAPMRTTTPSLPYRTTRRIRWTVLAAYPFLMANVWIDRSRTRRELAELEDCQLRDAGIDPDFVWNEIRKPFWRA